MMTQELQVSILAAPLAAMDRRVLSQAWYSALGIAPRTAYTANVCRTGDRGGAAGARERALAETMVSNTPESIARSCVLRIEKDSGGPGGDLSGPTQRAVLAKRIERTFGEMTSLPKRATFSMGRGGARVHVILQTSPAGIVLLALCRPDMRALVARALTQARSALAARGIILDLCEAGGFVCS